MQIGIFTATFIFHNVRLRVHMWQETVRDSQGEFASYVEIWLLFDAKAILRTLSWQIVRVSLRKLFHVNYQSWGWKGQCFNCNASYYLCKYLHSCRGNPIKPISTTKRKTNQHHEDPHESIEFIYLHLQWNSITKRLPLYLLWFRQIRFVCFTWEAAPVIVPHFAFEASSGIFVRFNFATT